LAEDKVLAWLTARGARVSIGTFSQLQAVAGVRLLD
jgi:hypothetical protein